MTQSPCFIGSCGIDIDINKGTYTNGEQIVGSITLQVNRIFVGKAIRLRIVGFEKALLYVPPNTSFNNRQAFYKQDLVVWSPRIDEQDGLEPGTYTFPFSFQLPPHLRPTFNYNNLVSVVYMVNSVLDCDTPLTSKCMEFNIYGTLARKWEEALHNSKSSTAKASKAPLFNPSNPVELSSHIVRTDLLIGGKVAIHMQIKNRSSATLNTIHIALVQKIEVHTKEVQKQISNIRVLSSFPCSVPQFLKGGEATAFSLDVKIPQVNGEDEVYPTITGKIIKVTHSFVVSLPGPDVSAEIPVVLWDTLIGSSEHLNIPSTNQASSIALCEENGTVKWKIDWLPEWVDGDSVPQCTHCNGSFTMFNRKHHCRLCGHVFCDKCTSTRATIKHLGHHEPVRICIKCGTLLPLSPSVNNQ